MERAVGGDCGSRFGARIGVGIRGRGVSKAFGFSKFRSFVGSCPRSSRRSLFRFWDEAFPVLLTGSRQSLRGGRSRPRLTRLAEGIGTGVPARDSEDIFRFRGYFPHRPFRVGTAVRKRRGERRLRAVASSFETGVGASWRLHWRSKRLLRDRRSVCCGALPTSPCIEWIQCRN